jgi:hypothetical protein
MTEVEAAVDSTIRSANMQARERAAAATPAVGTKPAATAAPATRAGRGAGLLLLILGLIGVLALCLTVRGTRRAFR